MLIVIACSVSLLSLVISILAFYTSITEIIKSKVRVRKDTK